MPKSILIAEFFIELLYQNFYLLEFQKDTIICNYLIEILNN